MKNYQPDYMVITTEFAECREKDTDPGGGPVKCSVGNWIEPDGVRVCSNYTDGSNQYAACPNLIFSFVQDEQSSCPIRATTQGLLCPGTTSCMLSEACLRSPTSTDCQFDEANKCTNLP